MSVARQVRRWRLPKPGQFTVPFVLRLAWGLISWFWIPGLLLAAILRFGAPAVLWTYEHPRGDRGHHLSCTWLSIQGPIRGAPRAGRCAALRLVPLNRARWRLPELGT